MPRVLLTTTSFQTFHGFIDSFVLLHFPQKQKKNSLKWAWNSVVNHSKRKLMPRSGKGSSSHFLSLPCFRLYKKNNVLFVRIDKWSQNILVIISAVTYCTTVSESGVCIRISEGFPHESTSQLNCSEWYEFQAGIPFNLTSKNIKTPVLSHSLISLFLRL